MIAGGWEKDKLGNLVQIKYGKDHKHLSRGVIPVYGSGGIMRYVDTPIYTNESILIPRKGTLSNLFYVDQPFWSVDTMFYTKISNKVNGKFLYYLLKTMDLASMDVGSAVPSLTTKLLNKLELYLPNLPTQNRVAILLTSLDDKIELNLQMNKTLESIAQAIFKEWFIDFRFPGFDGELIDVVNADGSVSRLPKGWRRISLGEVVKVRGGATPSTKIEEYWVGPVNWATPKDLSAITSPILLATERTITEEGVKQISSGILPKGTLLLSSRAPIGYLAISQIPVSINQGFIAILEKDIPNLFMLFWLQTNMKLVKSRANGSTFQEISKSNFKEIKLNLPTQDLFESFRQLVDPLFQKIVNNEVQNKSLSDIRDNLLPRLISGKIRV